MARWAPANECVRAVISVASLAVMVGVLVSGCGSTASPTATTTPTTHNAVPMGRTVALTSANIGDGASVTLNGFVTVTLPATPGSAKPWKLSGSVQPYLRLTDSRSASSNEVLTFRGTKPGTTILRLRNAVTGQHWYAVVSVFDLRFTRREFEKPVTTTSGATK